MAVDAERLGDGLARRALFDAQNPARLGKAGRGDGVGETGGAEDRRVEVTVDDEGPAPATGVQEALKAEATDRLAHCRPAHPEGAGKLDLCREALVELARGKPAAQLSGKLGPKRQRVARVEWHDRDRPCLRGAVAAWGRAHAVNQPITNEPKMIARTVVAMAPKSQSRRRAKAMVLVTSPATGVRIKTSTPATIIASPLP